MKVLHEAKGHGTIVEVPPGSSFLCWSDEGEVEGSLLSSRDPPGAPEGEYFNAGAAAAAAVLVAWGDPLTRKWLIAKLNELGKDPSDVE